MNNSELVEACERVLAENMADVATELRLINVLELIAFIRDQSGPTIEDLVNSAAELYFKHGALRYAWSAEFDVLWEGPPSVSLNLEFCWQGVTAFFRLGLNSAFAEIGLQHIATDQDFQGAASELLAMAISDARAVPPRRACGGASLRI